MRNYPTPLEVNVNVAEDTRVGYHSSVYAPCPKSEIASQSPFFLVVV